MSISKVAKRYAQGFLDFSQETETTDLIFSEMQDIVKVMSESKELNRFFSTPFIELRKKESVAGEIFKNFSDNAKRMIALVIRHGRESHLKEIAQEFINKVEDLRGVQRVSLTSASDLSKETIKKIIDSSNLVKNTFDYDLKIAVKPDILGGYILRVGDQQIDASVKSQLSQIKKEFQLN